MEKSFLCFQSCYLLSSTNPKENLQKHKTKKGFPSATIKQIPNPLLFFVDAKEAKLFADEKSVSQSLDAFFFILVSCKTQQTLLNHSFTPSLQTLQTLNNQTHHSFSSQIPKTHIHFCKLTTTTTHFAIKSIATRTTHLQQNFIAPKSISTRPHCNNNNNPFAANPLQQNPFGNNP
jgi:hypothetical protein